MATQNINGEHRIDIRDQDIPPIPTHQTSLSSSNGHSCESGCFIPILSILNVIQIVASVAGLWEHPPDNKTTAWVVVYASGCAVMIPLLYFRCRYARTLNPCQRNVMEVFWTIMSFFFLVWSVLGVVWIFGTCSHHDAPIWKPFLVLFLLGFCMMYGMPALTMTSVCIWLGILAIVLVSPKEKPGGASTPDFPNALPTYKYKSKENGGSGDEGGMLLAAGTKKKRTLSGEDAVCCICLGKYADNDEVREVPCCSHFFHVGCLDKWLKMKPSCPLCQSELPGAGRSAT